MEERRIIEGLLRREEEALDALMRRYNGLLCYVIRPILQDEGEVEECLSDIHLKIWEKIDSFDSAKGSLSAYLTVIARNAALNRLRRANVRPDSLDALGEEPAVEGPEDILLRKERLERLVQVVNGLKPKEQALFYRKYYYCQSSEQISAELGLSIRAVEGRLHRLRKKLSAELGGDAL